MSKVLRFILVFIFFFGPSASSIKSSEGPGINDIVKDNLEESAGSFFKNTGSDIQDYVTLEVEKTTTEVTDQITSPEFLELLKQTVINWWGQVVSFFQFKLEQFGNYSRP